MIERAVILAGGPLLELADLPEEFGGRARAGRGGRVARWRSRQLETEHIRRVLAASRNLEEAARTLGINPATLYRKRQKLGLP